MTFSAKSCSKCGKSHKRRGRYCFDCHAAYMREWRKTHLLNPEQRKRDSARSYANSYKQRGRLIQKPCEKCGSRKSQMHHIDYELPLDVTWLCRPCHLGWHEHWRNVSRLTFLAWLTSKQQQPKKAA